MCNILLGGLAGPSLKGSLEYSASLSGRADGCGAPLPARSAARVYRLPDEVWAAVEAGEPPGLYKGPVELDDGRWVDGILYPEEMTAGDREITQYGGWRGYLAARDRSQVD